MLGRPRFAAASPALRTDRQPRHPAIPEKRVLKKTWLIVLCLAGGVHAADLAPLPQQGRVASLSAEVIAHYHYRPQPFDDALSAAIFDRYLKSLDGDKFYFLKSDIDQLSQYRTRLDDAIIDGKLQAPFAIFNLYTRRVGERFTYARALLKGGFTFDQDDSFQFAREKADWAASENEIREVWRQRVKNDWLRLKIAGKDEREIASMLDKRYESSLRRISQLKSEDAFQTFMNAYTTSIEPHTNYLGPRAAADFDISMRLSLSGIGAVLQEHDEYTTIREVTAGGPAALSGQLKPGDRIVGVAQGETAAFTDVLGWRLDDTVALIRGQADTLVRLDILPAGAGPDGKHKVVSLVRKKISLEEQAARKSIVRVQQGGSERRIGVVTLPGFYEDAEGRHRGEPGFRSASRDVARLLDELKKEKVDGILVDLRNNGGGSLREAVDMTGLFIDTGPVVMERSAEGRIFVDGDSVAGAAWDGPLGVLINGNSASASEIFAAAIQDYGRGVVIGEASYGKGTVQTVLDLDRAAKSARPTLGELKLTIAQFFRINGGTTQLRGVVPDIAFPASSDPKLNGEASNDNALPWTRIHASNFERVGDPGELLPELQARHAARVGKDAEFQKMSDEIAEFRRQRLRTTLSLREDERRREKADLDQRFPGKGRTDDGLLDSEREISAQSKEPKPADALQQEAANIVGDQAELLKLKGRLALRLSPRPANPAPTLQ